MKSYIFVDVENFSYGKVIDDKLIEIKFYDNDVGNIYRAKVINKIDSINAYFLEYDKDKQAFLKSSKSFKIGDSVIGQIVRPKSNNKLPLFSVNFKIETDNYELSRFPSYMKPLQKDDKIFSKDEYKYLLELRARLEKEENFNPSPKLLLKTNIIENYLDNNKEYLIKNINIKQDLIISNALKQLKANKIYKDDLSIIIDELETLTVIDVNSSAKKSNMDNKLFSDLVNTELLDTIAYNLKVRNIGGMVLIDFLRNDKHEKLEKELIDNLDSYNLDYEIYGFTNMGLFELTLKRRGKSLKEELSKRKL